MKLFAKPSIELQGYCSPEFSALSGVFQRILPAQAAGGAAICVYYQGTKVVDLWAGSAREGEAWQKDTMALSYSTGKAALATLVHRLVDQGLLDYDRPLAADWPEFAQQGKGGITLRHVLSHQSGLYDVRNTIQAATEMLDWQAMLRAYEVAKPRFGAGAATAYQALSYGWLLGGLIEKVTGQALPAVFEKELVQPLGLDGAYFGVPADQLHRVAKPVIKPVDPSQAAVRSSTPRVKPVTGTRRSLTMQEKLLQLTGIDPFDAEDALMPKGVSRFSFFNDKVLQACIPAANGVFTARSLAKMYDMLVHQGRVDGQQYLSPERVLALSQVQTRQRDRVMPLPMHWRLGYHRVLSFGKQAPQGLSHIGYNGSGALGDPSRGLSFAYVHNLAGSSIAGDYRLWWLTHTALQAADRLA